MKNYRILVLSDQPCRAIWDFYKPETFQDIDLIISAGDLPADYLSFIATFFNGPVLYVHGNHDDRYRDNPPGGCINIEDTIYNFHGIRILGLGGSMRYKPGPLQYTQNEMHRRVMKLWWKLRRSRGIDILVTHAPAKGINDRDNLVHEGFEAFTELIEKYHPRYLIHGHVHLNYGNQPRVSVYEGTVIINAFERYVFDYDADWTDCEKR